MQYQRHFERTRMAMEQHGIDLMYLNYGPHMEYITGISTPMYYDNFKSPGDWVTGVIFGLDQDPVLVFQKDFFVEYDEKKIWLFNRISYQRYDIKNA